MKRPKPRHAPKRLHNLREDNITCMYCEQPRPAAGAVAFHRHLVCSGCTTKLQSQTTPTKAAP
jgi:hypothetical protein